MSTGLRNGGRLPRVLVAGAGVVFLAALGVMIHRMGRTSGAGGDGSEPSLHDEGGATGAYAGREDAGERGGRPKGDRPRDVPDRDHPPPPKRRPKGAVSLVPGSEQYYTEETWYGAAWLKEPGPGLTPADAQTAHDLLWQARAAIILQNPDEIVQFLDLASSMAGPHTHYLQEMMREDPYYRCRSFGAAALREIKDPVTAPSLVEAMLGDQNHFVREVAAQALGQIGRPEYVEVLDQVAERDSAENVRAAAHKAIGEIQTQVRSPER